MKVIVCVGKDVICIVYMSVIWIVGKKYYGWIGDWGLICGGFIGFFSGIEVRFCLLFFNRIIMIDRMYMIV